MAVIQGYKVNQLPRTVLMLEDTGYLDGLETYRNSQYRIKPSEMRPLATLHKVEKADVTKTVSGYVVPNYYSDMYSRIYVIPHLVNLGSIATEQAFTVSVWNATKHSVQLTSLHKLDAEGIEVSGDAIPARINALALRHWAVKVKMNGPASIDALFKWHFLNENAVTLSIFGSRSTNWQFFPDWSDNVVENIEFLTTVHQSLTGAEQRIAKRLSPRRSFEFKLLLNGNERQLFNNMIYAYGSRVWSIPVFTDECFLSKDVAQGDDEIWINTKGYDFYEGGRALLIYGLTQEMVDIVEIETNKIKVKRPVVNYFPLDSKVYPLRSAVLTDMPQLNHLSDNACTAQVRLQIVEHNHCEDDVSYLPRYREHYVLEPSSEWSEDVTHQYLRLIKRLDNKTGIPYHLDVANNAFQVMSHRFMPVGREEQFKLRQLFYYLRGRQRAIWVSSACSDLTLVSNVKGKSIDVHFCQYTTALFEQAGRRDIRIECNNGEIYYRRILSATVVDDNTERLGLDGDALELNIDDVLKISFITLSRLQQDTIRWEHNTDADGSAVISVAFYGLRDDLESM